MQCRERIEQVTGRQKISCAPHCEIVLLYQILRQEMSIPSRGTNILPENAFLKMIFLFPRWYMLVPWRVFFVIFL